MIRVIVLESWLSWGGWGMRIGSLDVGLREVEDDD